MSNWTSHTPTKRGEKGNGSLAFVQGESCPMYIIPSLEDFVEFTDIFDQTTQKSREPRPGEKGRKRYVFKAVESRKVEGKSVARGKAVVCGSQVMDQIAAHIKTTLTASDNKKVPVLTITASGTGRNTEYSVEAASMQEASVLEKYEDDFGKLDLLKIRDGLVGKIDLKDAFAGSGGLELTNEPEEKVVDSKDLGF